MATLGMNKILTNNNLKLSDFYGAGRRQSLSDRVETMYSFIQNLNNNNELTYHRLIVSPPDRTVQVYNKNTRATSKMLMFGSNNYLGFANHPYVLKKVKESLVKYGTGIGGPPLLNGNIKLKDELEERLADLKKQEDAIIFPSGYCANLGLIGTLAQTGDHVLFDSYSHASFYDGIKLSRATAKSFAHNDLNDLERKLELASSNRTGEIYIGVEGVYSMDGDLAPLKNIVSLAKQFQAIIILDDAHGTCVLGENGSGTAEHFNLTSEIDISMGTFSKSFAMSGGFVTASREIINYLKYSSRPYMFSAALPPATLAAVLAGLDLLEEEPWLRDQLKENSRYTKMKLQKFGICTNPKAAIIALKVPDWMDIRKANRKLDELNFFINAIEYPAVAKNEQRFRISLMAQHTKQDIDALTSCLEAIWEDNELKYEQS